MSNSKMHSRSLVILTEGLTGHRVKWLANLVSLANSTDLSLSVICLKSAFNNLALEQNQFDEIKSANFILVENRNEIFESAQMLHESDWSVTFIVWDADEWLLELIRCHFKVQALFMRPYVTEFRLKSLANYCVKKILTLILLIKPNVTIGLLEVPEDRHFFFRQKWKVDDLTTWNFQFPNYNKAAVVSKNAKILLVPGFITARKNPKMAISVLNELRTQTQENWILVFVGKINTDSNFVLDLAIPEHIEIMNRYVSDAEYLNFIRECDALLLLYRNRSASGAVIEGLLLNRNVFLAKTRIWKSLTRKSNGLLHLVPLKAEAIARHISQIDRWPKQSEQIPNEFAGLLLNIDFAKPGLVEFFLS